LSEKIYYALILGIFGALAAIGLSVAFGLHESVHP
jgi:hypothetical protein